MAGARAGPRRRRPSAAVVECAPDGEPGIRAWHARHHRSGPLPADLPHPSRAAGPEVHRHRRQRVLQRGEGRVPRTVERGALRHRHAQAFARHPPRRDRVRQGGPRQRLAPVHRRGCAAHRAPAGAGVRRTGCRAHHPAGIALRRSAGRRRAGDRRRRLPRQARGGAPARAGQDRARAGAPSGGCLRGRCRHPDRRGRPGRSAHRAPRGEGRAPGLPRGCRDAWRSSRFRSRHRLGHAQRRAWSTSVR